MPKQVFVNLPVRNLSRSITFFKSLGYAFNDQFTDDTAACMVISPDIYAMLLTEPKFQMFVPRGISNAHESTEVLVALNCESRKEVDEMVSRAVVAGASIFSQPQDHGFMYGHAFQDLDGHIWEYFWMDPNFVKPPAQA